MPNVWNTAEMVYSGVPVDKDLLGTWKVNADECLRELEQFIYKSLGHTFDITSPQQLGYALFGQRKGVRRFNPRGKSDSGNYDTSGTALRTLYKEDEDSRELVLAILHYRKLIRVKTAYLDRFIVLLSERDSCLHTRSDEQAEVSSPLPIPGDARIYPAMAPSTIAGRYRCSSPNLLGLPKKYKIDIAAVTRRSYSTTKSEPLDFSVRKLIRAKAGYKIVAADFSQIDMRGIAHYSRDARLLDAFAKEKDLHLGTLIELYPDEVKQLVGDEQCDVSMIKSRDEDTKQVVLMDGNGIPLTAKNFETLAARRREMKAVNFGLSYGMGAAALMDKLNNPDNIDDLEEFVNEEPCTLDKAEKIVNRFFKRFSRIPLYKERVREQFFGAGREDGVPGGAFRNCFGRTLFTAPYYRLWGSNAAPEALRQSEVTLDVRTDEGPVRVKCQVLKVSEDGIFIRINMVCEIELPKRPHHYLEPSQKEREEIRTLHDEAEETNVLFESDKRAVLDAEKSLLAEPLPIPRERLFEFERTVRCAVKVQESERGSVLVRESCHPGFTGSYEQSGQVPFCSLPYLLIDHKDIEVIRLQNDGKFIGYPPWSNAFRELASYVISSTSTDIAKTAMINMRQRIAELWPDRKREFRLLLCVHDELVYEVPADQSEWFKDELLSVMRMKPAQLGLDVDASADVGDTYYDAKP